MKARYILGAVFLAALVFAASPSDDFHFVILGDRTGEAQPGIFERVLKDASASHPEFILTAGDLIEGLHDDSAQAQWQAILKTLQPYRTIPFYFTPGNHDVWSAASEDLYRRSTSRPLHYSFDHGDSHFTVLDNSRADALPPAELAFLESDLRAHPDAKVKLVVMHRPTWIVNAPLRNAAAPLHRIAKQYGVRYYIAGHIHQLIHTDFDGVTYYAVPSAGGHLRLSGKYEDGWFFGWTEVQVKNGAVTFRIHSLDEKVNELPDWGLSGLVH